MVPHGNALEGASNASKQRLPPIPMVFLASDWEQGICLKMPRRWHIQILDFAKVVGNLVIQRCFKLAYLEAKPHWELYGMHS